MISTSQSMYGYATNVHMSKFQSYAMLLLLVIDIILNPPTTLILYLRRQLQALLHKIFQFTLLYTENILNLF